MSSLHGNSDNDFHCCLAFLVYRSCGESRFSKKKKTKLELLRISIKPSIKKKFV